MKPTFRPLLILIVSLLLACEKPKTKEQPAMPQDPHSFSTPTDAVVKHLNWKASVDFNSKTITAVASWQIENYTDSDIIIFDTKGLVIQKVTLDENTPAEFRLSDRDELLGQALAVLIRPETKVVNIFYKTSPGAEALQWLDPQQTAGKKQPFLFTQSQAILARSWVPCQDSPNVRFAYEAEVNVPGELLALMSASNPQQRNVSGTYFFKMEQPIPSYLLALTVGDFSFKPISGRAGVYAEPSVLEKAAWEFADLEQMVSGAEELYGKYRWERYDVIVLPPSFPFGGMENPRLTFATPTILAGDRSLTSLIAHELAHSWSGNLVTNATWNDFWLNEGFTVYFEHRIMEKLYGKDYSEMLAQLSLQDLKETITLLKNDNLYQDTRLKLDLAGRNPDDGVTDIAYNKGYFFLRLIEETHGRDKFDRFLNDYFSQNAFHSIDTDRFINYISGYYKEKFGITLSDADFKRWIFTEGLPENCPMPVSSRFAQVDEFLRTWEKSNLSDRKVTEKWSTHEWLHFLKNLPDSLTQSQMGQLDDFGNFTRTGNAEIATVWFVLAVRTGYKPAYSALENFLVNTGRRKFLSPIYQELTKTTEGKAMAQRIYQKARPNYHYVASSTFDKLLK
jgi:leukotriene-A4 hydrolase